MLSEKNECFEIEYARLVDPKTRAFGMQADQIPPRQLVVNLARSSQESAHTFYHTLMQLVECAVGEDVRFFPAAAFTEIKPLKMPPPEPQEIDVTRSPDPEFVRRDDIADEQTATEQEAGVPPVFDPNPGRLGVPPPPEPHRRVGRPRK